MKQLKILLLAANVFFFTFVKAQTPTISSFSPLAGGPGDTIIITGNNFSNNTVSGVTMSCGASGEIAYSIISATKIAIYLGVGSGQCVSTIYLKHNNSVIASIGGFNWGSQPVIFSVVPNSAGSGDPVKIIGKYLALGRRAQIKPDVTFGNIAATIANTKNRDTIKAIIGDGATGDIQLTTILGTTTFTGFTYENTIKIHPSSRDTIPANIVGTSYQWQVNTGTGFNNISNNSYYSNTISNTLILNNIPTSWSGYQYKCIVDNYTSLTYTLRMKNKWTGAQNNLWNNPANWSSGILPDTYTDVIINSGNINLNVNATIRTLKINSNASINAAGNILTVLY